MEKKKVVLKLELHDGKAKQKAMKVVSGLPGIESIAVDMKEKKLTVIGDVDPAVIASRLRKLCRADILTVGSAKEAEKKKDEPKNGEGKQDEAKQIAELVKAYEAYNPHYYNNVQSSEENPNACVFC